MRRIPAILLLGLLSFSLIEPAVFAESEGNVPACCRRNGTHHCAMAASQGPSVQTACSFYPQRDVVAASGRTAAACRLRTAPALLAAYRPGRAQTETRLHESHSRNHDKRGPPVA